MSIRQSSNVDDQWREFCGQHARDIDQLPRLLPLFSSNDRFDQFLQTGVDQVDADTLLTIMSLTNEEWVPFAQFIHNYSRDWSSCFTRAKYVGFYRELDQRQWRPSTAAVETSDFASPRLLIHVWAAWDAHDRTLDKNLFQIMPRFAGQVEFRSLDIDRPEFREFYRSAGVINVPTLVFYRSGRVSHSLVGVRKPEAISEEIATWLATPSSPLRAVGNENDTINKNRGTF